MTVASDQQQVVRMPEARKRLDQDRDILLAGETAGVNQQPCLLGKAQPGTQSRGAAFRMKDFRIHSERLVHRVCDADAVQKLAHEAAGCEHNIEALIQPAQIAAKRALSESAAKAPAKDLWQIR